MSIGFTGTGSKRRIFTPLEATRGADRIYPAADPVPLERADLVIEAAVEKLEIKKQIFADLCDGPGMMRCWRPTPSALPISEIGQAEGFSHPERLLGIHFFNPVHRMKAGRDRRDRGHLGGCHRDGPGLRPPHREAAVVVKDSPGFVVNRILMPYLNEAGRLFDRGLEAREIDEAMLDFGMPMGPIRLLDEIGLDVALHVADTMGAALGRAFRGCPAILRHLVEKEAFGREERPGILRIRRRRRRQEGAPGQPGRPGSPEGIGTVRG